MSDIWDKTKKWLGKIKFREINYAKNGIKPVRDWYVIITAIFILTFVAAGMAYYFYIQIDQGQFFSSDSKPFTKTISIDSQLLGKTVDDINERAKTLSAFQQNGTVPADPSL